MSRHAWLVPAQDRCVRRPDGRVLPAAGDVVLLDSYWERRLTAGDVVREQFPTNKPDVADNMEDASSP